jgi:hypothetical protein
LERNSGLCSTFFRRQAICFQISNERQPTTGPQNFAAAVVLQESPALACILIGMHGRNVRKSADIHSDLHKKDWGTVVVLYTKPTQKARAWFALLWMNTKQQQLRKSFRCRD